MRRIIILFTFMLVFLAVFQVSRLVDDWHYVVPAEPGELLYATAFDDPVADWELVEGGLSAQAADGVLRLGVSSRGEGIYSTASPYFDDFDMEAQIRIVADTPESGFGVIFRQRDRSNYYVFFISGDGYYRVVRVLDNQSRDLSAWHSSPLINQGTGALNIVRVIGQGDRFRFYINDEAVELCIPESEDALSTPLADGTCLGGEWRLVLVDDAIPYGRLGAAGQVDLTAPEAGLIVEYDYMIVYGPEPLDDE